MSVEMVKLNAWSFQQNFHAEGRRQYDHHTKLKVLQERFTLWTEQLPQDIGMKPTNLKSIKYRIAQLQNFMRKFRNREFLSSRVMQVYLQNLANLNLAHNVPINLMRNVLGFSQVSKKNTGKLNKNANL